MKDNCHLDFNQLIASLADSNLGDKLRLCLISSSTLSRSFSSSGVICGVSEKITSRVLIKFRSEALMTSLRFKPSSRATLAAFSLTSLSRNLFGDNYKPCRIQKPAACINCQAGIFCTFQNFNRIWLDLFALKYFEFMDIAFTIGYFNYISRLDFP